jgi:hypothetical protein
MSLTAAVMAKNVVGPRRMLASRLEQIGLLLVAFLILSTSSGCSGSKPRPSAPADSTGTIVGNLTDTFVHGNPFYGSVVFLIQADPVSVEWWEGLARYRVPLVYPERDTRLNIVGRTVCTP